MENQTPTQPTEPEASVLDEGKLLQYKERLRMDQNMAMAFAGGSGAALVGGVAWAAVTVITGYQIGWMAVGVGFLVGYSVRYLGKGIDTIFGVIGAALALLGCLLGNFFSLIGFASKQENIGVFDILSSIDYNIVPQAMMEAFSPMDLLFYGIAVYEGYRFSFRQITQQEVVENLAK